MVQKVTYQSVLDAAMHLDPAERCQVAACLWDSLGSPSEGKDVHELEEILNRRELELDEDPSQEMSHEDFMASFSQRRRP